MSQTLEINRTYTGEDWRERFRFRNPIRREPRLKRLHLLRPPIVSRLSTTWFALRTWEDDGGGPLCS